MANVQKAHGSTETEADLRAYWRVFVRRKWVIASVVAVVAGLVLVVSLRQTPAYASAATLVIDLSAPRVLDNQQVQDVVDTGSGGFWYSKEYYETQYRVITSRAVAQRVVEKLQLQSDDRFLGLDAISDPVKRELTRRRSNAVEILRKRTKVIPVKESRIVQVQVEDQDPRQAAALANSVAEAYIAESLAVRSTTTQSASEWLEQQLADLEGKLAKSGKELFDFKKEHDIVATSWEDRQSAVSQSLAAINDALTKARIQRAQLEARRDSIQELRGALQRGDEALAAFEPVTANTVIQTLKVKYMDAKMECAELAARYLDHHPRTESCTAKVADARASLDHEIENVLTASERQFDEAVRTEQKMVQLAQQAKADAFRLNQYERDYLELKRTNDNNQRLYELVLKRLKDTGITGMLQMSNVRILDRAEPSTEPVRPRPLRNLALGAVLGAVLGIGLAFLLEFLDTSVKTREQVEDVLGLPFLGVIPQMERGDDHGEPDLFVHAHPQSAPAECLRSLRTNLLFMSPEKPLRTMVVTSSGPGEGKTTTASALAETMADAGSRVLLLDADMRRPRLHRVFDVSNDRGLSSLILGEHAADEVIHPTRVTNLSVLPSGPIPPNPTELLQTTAFRSRLEELAKRYDRVIVDSPPAGLVADSIILATQVDGTLLVLKSGETSRDAAIRTIRALRDVKAHVLGAVLNHLDLHTNSYGYYRYYQLDPAGEDVAAG